MVALLITVTALWGTAAQGGETPVDPVTWARNAVAAAWGVPAGNVELEWPGGPPLAPPVPAASLGLQGTGAGGRWWLVMEEGGRRRRTALSARVRIRLPVARQALARGIPLTAPDFSWEEIWRAEPPAPGWDGTPEGWVTTRPIPPGEVLLPPAVRAPVAVRAGEEVEVRVRREGILLQGRGTALRSGGVGDTVDIRVGAGLRRRARIVGEGSVELTRPGGQGGRDG